MATKVQVYNGALSILGKRFLATETDNTEERRYLDQYYPDVVEFMLEEGFWNFAARMVAITADTEVETTFGHRLAFEKPSDWVRTVEMASNERMFPPLEDGEFTDEGNYWYASIEPLYVQYISNGTDYGYNLGDWPSSFKRAVEFQLALRVGPHLASMSQNAIDILEKRAEKALKNARSKDAMNQGAQRLPSGRLIQARQSMRTSAGQAPWWRS